MVNYPLPLLTFISTSNQPCATDNRIKCYLQVPSVLSKIKLSSRVIPCISSFQAQKLFSMHFDILEYCSPKLLSESCHGQMVLFFCQFSSLNSVTSVVHIFSFPDRQTSLWAFLYQALHYPHILVSLLCSCFYATVFSGAIELGLLEVYSVQPQLGCGYLLGNCLFIPHWIFGSFSSVADPDFSLLSLIFPYLSLQLTTFSIPWVRCELTIYLLSTSCISFINLCVRQSCNNVV